MPVNFKAPATKPSLDAAKKIADAIDALHEAHEVLSDHLLETYDDTEVWDDDPASILRDTLQETQQKLFEAVNEQANPLGFRVQFNRLYPRYELIETRFEEHKLETGETP